MAACRDKEEKVVKRVDKSGRKKLVITRTRECVEPPTPK